jgi:imidazolonepropionase
MRGPAPRRGLFCSDLGVIRDGSLLIEDGRISEVGSTRRIENLRKAREARLIDVTGKVVTPGLIDSHMRLASSPQLQAFEQRIAGLAAPPGGMRAAQRSDGQDRSRRWLQLAASSGATTVEVRSGRGAAPLQELRALRATAKLDGDPIEVRAGFSTASPSERERAAAERVEEVLRRGSSPSALVSALDLDCGGHRVDWPAARLLLAAAARSGCRANVQADPWHPGEAVRFAVEGRAFSVERLEAAGEAEIDALAASSTVAALLPNVVYHGSATRFPPARRMIDRGAAISLASGFSPGAHPGFGLPMAMALGCREMRLMPEEAITCCTINAAAAIGQASRIGSLEPDKEADLAVFDVSDYREIPYFFGVSLCLLTIKRGRVVYRALGHGRATRELE